MVHVGQAVPHRHAGIFRQVLHRLLVKAPVLDAVKEPAQDPGAILQALLLAHLAAGRVQIGDVGPLLGGRHLEGAAGAGGGLLKEQDNVLALQGRIADAGSPLALEIVAQVQQIPDLLGRQVHEGEEGFSFQINCHVSLLINE